jgi:glycosyltransferase involved in cell wall biosynthesis
VSSSDHATIALDFRWLDHLNLGNGQYRYCIDLINGLANLPSDCRFVVVGSQPEPPEPIRHVFSDARWRYLQLRGWNFKGADYLYHLRYAWLLRRERVDLLHSLHTFVPLLPGARRVITIYDMMCELFSDYRDVVASRPYRLFKRAVQTQSPLIIAISQSTADDINRLWGIPKSNITVVHLSAEPARPCNRSTNGNVVGFARQPFVLSPFNLEPRKNLVSLLRAMTEVRRSHPDVRLVLYGRAAVTPDRERTFHANVRQLELEEAVTLTGFVSDDELASLYRHALVFVFPSLYEGFGLPVLEAMAAGACTVARNRSAMAEVLGDAGVQTETEDAASLATTLRSLLEDPARRAALGRAAQQRSARFTLDAMSRGTYAAYMKALDLKTP